MELEELCVSREDWEEKLLPLEWALLDAELLLVEVCFA